jgi:hypothetical protein
MLVLLLAALDQTIVATALPTIVADGGSAARPRGPRRRSAPSAPSQNALPTTAARWATRFSSVDARARLPAVALAREEPLVDQVADDLSR